MSMDSTGAIAVENKDFIVGILPALSRIFTEHSQPLLGAALNPDSLYELDLPIHPPYLMFVNTMA